MKDKPQLLPGPQIGSVLQPDKPLISSATMAPAGSPGASAHLQSQSKGAGVLFFSMMGTIIGSYP